jgi:energy-converting hydrogenase Eha subunit A
MALLTPGGVTVAALPVLRSTRNGKMLTVFDVKAFRAAVEPLADLGVDVCVIELVGGISGQSASAAFNFGRTCGMIAAVCEHLFPRVAYVPPATWRGKLGVHGYARRTGIEGKDASRAVATELWPADAAQFRRKKDDGPAEAALLAEYGRRFLL